jgi:hypothetical protein
MSGYYLAIDPYHDYAARMMSTLFHQHGLRAVCLHADRATEAQGRHHYPLISERDVVAAHVFADARRPEEVAASLRKYNLAGVIAHSELVLERIADLLEHLPIKWNRPDTLRLFRDKGNLKAHLAAKGVPVNYTRKVRSANDVFAERVPSRFVLKPNGGYGNRDIGFFNADERIAVEKFFAQVNEEYLLEEFLAGTEYCVNGQVDAEGNVHVFQIFEYERTAANGIANLYWLARHVKRSEPVFEAIDRYTHQVLKASGLVRSPFHIEVMRTSDGIQLIEAGARFGGLAFPSAGNDAHGAPMNAYQIAAHFYVSEKPLKNLGTNWDHYDRINFHVLDGVATKTERVFQLEGIAEVESFPEFRRWVRRPSLGARVHRTVDLFTAPYSLHVMNAGSEDALREVGINVRRLIQWNQRLAPRQRARAIVDGGTRILADRLRTAANRLLPLPS